MKTKISIHQPLEFGSQALSPNGVVSKCRKHRPIRAYPGESMAATSVDDWGYMRIASTDSSTATQHRRELKPSPTQELDFEA